MSSLHPILLRLFRPIALEVGFAGALLALASACSPAPEPVSQSPRDPSSPTAPEGARPLAVASVTMASAMPARSAPEHAHDHGGPQAAPATSSEHPGHGRPAPASSADAGPQGVVYVCPMHPEVTSNAPGICPKCNMKLVPKK
jgi:hypothetical protein